ncbi:MAG: alpha/beta hydrolase [Caldilineaceae bacterium]|nr:alpha/beta hydrolase [Caldilineaceae bacterium]
MKSVFFNLITLLIAVPWLAACTELTVTPQAEPGQGELSVIPGGGPSGGAAFSSVAPTFTDLAYADQSDTQKLDLYLPEGDGPFPLVIMVHGGGFMFGDKADGMGLTGVDQLLANGYAVSSINYRLSGEAQYPAQIYDAKAAVRFLRANASEYKLDPERLGAWGASAGGNLVALLGTTCGVNELEGVELGNADQSSCVQAVVDWFGPIDFLALDEQFADTGCPQNHNDADSPESRLLGAAIQTVPDLAATANPMNYITPDDAPFFIQHGSADCNIPPVQGKNLADALAAVIGQENATFILIDGAGHGGEQFEAADNVALVLDFLNAHLQ